MVSHRRNREVSERDPRLLPAYGFTEAAHYLRIPSATLRAWALGRGSLAPVFHLDDPSRQNLSFMNLVEAHILAAIRRKHGVGLRQIRRALDYVQKRCHLDRPLIDQSFQTDGRSLFTERLEQLVNASRGGQLAMPDLLPRLDRIERDTRGLPLKLYPFTRRSEGTAHVDAPRLVVVNPLVSFGRPSVDGVPTSTIWGRFRAGDSPAYLAEDYGLTVEAIEEAIRCEAA